MPKKYFLLGLTGAALLCGCNKQAKINSEKIQILSQNIVQFEQSQARQMAAVQSQLTALAPSLDRINGTYFEKSHDDAIFFHTNTLYLLLTIDKQIEAQLQVADAGRVAQGAQAYSYYTNQLGALYLCTAQIEEALAGAETRIETEVNAETRRVGASLGEDLQKQIKLASPTADEISRRRELEAEVGQIKLELDQIKEQLANTNPPARFK